MIHRHVDNIQNTILIDLFKSKEGLDPYTIARKHRLSPMQLFEAISQLQNLGYLVSNREKGYFLSITKTGKELVLKLRTQRAQKGENRVPVKFIGNKISPDSPYVPRISKLWKDFAN